MKALKLCLIAFLLTIGPVVIHAQPVLSVDFNLRTANQTTVTQPGFNSFILGNVGGNIIQTQATVRAFGPYTVTLAGLGGNPGLDDRDRNSPVDGGAISTARLLRDFVFSRETAANGGLDVTIDGLTPNTPYVVTVWSYDSGSQSPIRYSDWSFNGTVVTNGYNFAGTPTTDTQFTFTFPTTSDGTGRIIISGRRSLSTAVNQLAVFINAFQISTPTRVGPAVTGQPKAATVYAGDNAILAVAASGSFPLFYQWTRNGDIIDDATNAVLNLFNVQAGDDADYVVRVYNDVDGTFSDPAHVTVLPVSNIGTALVSYWPLDVLGDTTPDLTASHNNFYPVFMDPAFIGDGARSNAFTFSNPAGRTNFFLLQYTNTHGLPLYSHSSYTVAMWVKGTGTGQSDRRVWSEGATNNNNPLMTIGTDNGGAVNGVDIFIRNDGGATGLNHVKSSLAAFDGAWHHVAWVDNNGFGAVYVDGIKDTNVFNYAKGGLTLNVASLACVYRTNAQVLFNGSIDDLAIWGRSLSATEIQTVMASGPLPPQPSIVSIGIIEGSVTLTYKTPDPNIVLRVEELPAIGGTWSEVQNVTFSPFDADTYRAQFAMPADSQRFYRLAY